MRSETVFFLIYKIYKISKFQRTSKGSIYPFRSGSQSSIRDQFQNRDIPSEHQLSDFPSQLLPSFESRDRESAPDFLILLIPGHRIVLEWGFSRSRTVNSSDSLLLQNFVD